MIFSKLANKHLPWGQMEELRKLNLMDKKFELTPEEKRVLDVSKDILPYLDYLNEDSHTKASFDGGLQELVKYILKSEKFVAFLRAKPEQAYKIFGKILSRIQDEMPAKNFNFISDAYDLAKDLLKKALPAVEKKVEPLKNPLDSVEPLKENDYELFNLKDKKDLTNLTEKEIADRYSSYFLGFKPKKVITKKGTIKKEYSAFFKNNKNNPNTLKSYLLSFYKLVRDVKSAAKRHGADDAWVYKQTVGMTAEKDVQNAIVSEKELEEEMGRTGKTRDQIEVMNTVRFALKQIIEIKHTLKSSKIQKKFQDLSDKIQSALPSVNTIEVYLNDINEELSNAGVTKEEFNTLYDYNSVTDKFTFAAPDIDNRIRNAFNQIKTIVSNIEHKKNVSKNVEEVTKEVLSSETPSNNAPEKKPQTLGEEIKNLVRQLEDENLIERDKKDPKYKAIENVDPLLNHSINALKKLTSLKSKDYTALNSLIESYVDLLRSYEEKNKKNFSGYNTSDIEGIVTYFNDFAKTMRGLSVEQEFNLMWYGRSRLFPQSSPPEGPTVKTSAFSPKKYQEAFNKFKVNTSALKKIDKLMKLSETDGLLDQVHKKLLSGAEATSRDLYDPGFKEDYSTNPLRGKPVTITTINEEGEEVETQAGPKDLAKTLTSLGNSLKNIKPGSIYDNANTHLRNLAKLPDVLTFSKTKKEAYSNLLRKFAYKIAGASKKEKTYTDWGSMPPMDSTRRPGKEERGPGVLLYRQRETPAGRRFLTDIFNDNKYIQEFIDEMEKAGMEALAEHDQWQKKKQEEGPDSDKKKPEIDKDRLNKMIADKVDVFGILAKIMNKMVAGKKEEGDDKKTKNKTFEEHLSHLIGSKKIRSLEDTHEIKKEKENYKNALKNLYEIDIELGGSGTELINEDELKNVEFTNKDIKEFRKEAEAIEENTKKISKVKEIKNIVNELWPIVNDPDKLIGYAKDKNLGTVADTVELFNLFKNIEKDYNTFSDILEKGSYATKDGPDYEQFEKVKAGAKLYMDMLAGGTPDSELGKKFLEKYNKITNGSKTEYPTHQEVKKLLEDSKKNPKFESDSKKLKIFEHIVDGFFKPDREKMKATRAWAKEKTNVVRYLGDAVNKDNKSNWAEKVFLRQRGTKSRFEELNNSLKRMLPSTTKWIDRREEDINKTEEKQLLESKTNDFTTEKGKIEKEKLLKLENQLKNSINTYEELLTKLPAMESAAKKLELKVKAWESLNDEDKAKNPDLEKEYFRAVGEIMGLTGKDLFLVDQEKIEKELNKYKDLPKLKEFFNDLSKEHRSDVETLEKIKNKIEEFIPDLEDIRNPGSELAKLVRENLELKRKRDKEALVLTKTKDLIAQKNQYTKLIKTHHNLKKWIPLTKEVVDGLKVIVDSWDSINPKEKSSNHNLEKKFIERAKSVWEEKWEKKLIGVDWDDEDTNADFADMGAVKNRLKETQNKLTAYEKEFAELSKSHQNSLNALKKVEHEITPGITKSWIYNKEAIVERMDEKLNKISEKIKYLRTKMVERTAASDQKSKFDMAMDTQSFPPQEYEEGYKSDIPFDSSKYLAQFDHVMDFYKNRLRFLKGSLAPELYKKYYAHEGKLYEKILQTGDKLKKTLINIGGESVPIFESLKKLSDLLAKNKEQETLLFRRRETHMKKLFDAKEKIENLKTYVDPKTGKAKNIPESELESYKKMIIKSLYRALESYWGNYITKQLSPLGERDNEYYNKVYDFFRQAAEVKSNRKLIGLLNQYKTSIRREIDDSENWDKIEELQKAKDAILAGYREFDIDPSKSSRVNNLTTRINTLVKHKTQVKTIFNEVAGLVNLSTNKAVEEKLSDLLEGEDISSDKEMGIKHIEEAEKQIEKNVEEKLEKIMSNSTEDTIESIAVEVVNLASGTKLEDQIKKLLGDIVKGRKKTEVAPEKDIEDKTVEEPKTESTGISSHEDLKQSASAVLMHEKGDNKYIFVVENKKQKKDLLDTGLLRADPKGRKKGTTYAKNGKTIYEVKIDMYEFPGVVSKDGDPADVWIGTNKEVRDQIQAILSGAGGGTLFKELVAGGDKGLSQPQSEVSVETTSKKIPDKVKEASYRNDINFNERILYSKTIQSKLSSMLDDIINRVAKNNAI